MPFRLKVLNPKSEDVVFVMHKTTQRSALNIAVDLMHSCLVEGIRAIIEVWYEDVVIARIEV